MPRTARYKQQRRGPPAGRGARDPI